PIIRTRYGPGPNTAVRAGLVTWGIAVLLPNLGYYPLGLFPARLLVISFLSYRSSSSSLLRWQGPAVQGTGIGVGSSPYSRLVMHRNLRVQEKARSARLFPPDPDLEKSATGPRPGGRDLVEEVYSIEILCNSLKSLRTLPVPSTTLHSGLSAIHTGSPVSSRIRLSKFLSKAPPPASTMPRSLMSAESSGGVRSNAARMALTMVETASLIASRISPSSAVIILGVPSMRLRPLSSILSGSSSEYADPISILIRSAVRSPMSRLYLRFR